MRFGEAHMEKTSQINKLSTYPPVSGGEQISPEMRDAGVAVIDRWHGVVDLECLAGDVYTAMVRARIS